MCYGPPGVGKTLSARHYARWDDVEDGPTEQRTTLSADIPPDLADCHTLVHTPKVATTPRRLSEDLGTLVLTFNELVRSARQAAGLAPPTRLSVVEFLIVDEADRLKMPELEEIRDRYAPPKYTGPLLIRGARLDGSGPLRFGATDPQEDLAIPGADCSSDGRVWGAQQPILADAPGCYAVHVDGTDFGQTIVFAIDFTAVPDTGEVP